MDRMKTAIDFKKESLGKLILKLSGPAFLAIVMNLLYGFVDGIFIGKDFWDSLSLTEKLVCRDALYSRVLQDRNYE